MPAKLYVSFSSKPHPFTTPYNPLHSLTGGADCICHRGGGHRPAATAARSGRRATAHAGGAGAPPRRSARGCGGGSGGGVAQEGPAAAGTADRVEARIVAWPYLTMPRSTISGAADRVDLRCRHYGEGSTLGLYLTAAILYHGRCSRPCGTPRATRAASLPASYASCHTSGRRALSHI